MTTTAPAITGTHPYADTFPMLPEDELAALADSIAVNGLRNPIIVTPDGLILDGRNRFAACQLADVTPTVEVYDSDDLAEFVLDLNINRRNMSTGARAMATALVLTAARKRENGRWEYGAQSDESVGFQARLRECGVVLDHRPALAPEVVSGGMTLSAAYDEANEERKNTAIRTARLDELRREAPRYISLIEEDVLTLDGAWAAYDEDTRKDREEREGRRKGLSDLYSGIATALGTLGGYGAYPDVTAVMNDFDPSLLSPPQLDRYFSLDNLRNAARFVSALLTMRGEQ